MKKLNLNSKSLLAFLAGKSLLLFLILPFIVFAADGSIPKGDSLGYRPSPNMYIAEGTVVYNANIISIDQENKPVLTKKESKKRNKNLAVSKVIIKKTVKIYQNTKIQNTKFKTIPSDSDSFFSTTSTKDNIVLPVNQQLKIAVTVFQNILLVFNNYNSIYSLGGLQNFTDDHHSRKLQIRPPPFSLI
jgi:hypothetical protein